MAEQRLIASKFATLVPPNLATLNALTAFLPDFPEIKMVGNPTSNVLKRVFLEQKREVYFERFPQKLFISIVLMTVEGIQPVQPTNQNHNSDPSRHYSP
jgi:hypothetical protein